MKRRKIISILTLLIMICIAAPINTWAVTQEDINKAIIFNSDPEDGEFNLSVVGTIGGSVYGSGYFDELDEITIIAVPNSGYHFFMWLYNGTGQLVDINEPMTTFIMPDRNSTVQAIFRQGAAPVPTPEPDPVIPRNVTVVRQNAALVTVPNGPFDPGTVITLVADQASAMNIEWTNVTPGMAVDAGLSSTSAWVVSYTVPDRDSTIIASLIEPMPEPTSSHNVVFSASQGATFMGAGLYEAGKTVTIEAVMNSEREFVRWITTSDIYLDNPNSSRTTFIMPNSQVQLTAETRPRTVAPERFHLTVIADKGGQVLGNKDGLYGQNARIELTARAESGWEFDKWITSGGGSFGAQSNRISLFTMPGNPVTVTATFKEIDDGTSSSSSPSSSSLDNATHSVSASVIPSGSGTVSGAGDFRENRQVTLTQSPSIGWRFVEWEVVSGDVEISDQSNARVVFRMPEEAVSIRARYERNAATVTINASQGGTASGNTGEREVGSSISLAATANAGWKFDKWQINAGSAFLSSNNSPSVTFTMPSDNVILTPIFVQDTSDSISSSGFEQTSLPTFTPPSDATTPPVFEQTPLVSEMPTTTPPSSTNPAPQTSVPSQIVVHTEIPTSEIGVELDKTNDTFSLEMFLGIIIAGLGFTWSLMRGKPGGI